MRQQREVNLRLHATEQESKRSQNERRVDKAATSATPAPAKPGVKQKKTKRARRIMVGHAHIGLAEKKKGDERGKKVKIMLRQRLFYLQTHKLRTNAVPHWELASAPATAPPPPQLSATESARPLFVCVCLAGRATCCVEQARHSVNAYRTFTESQYSHNTNF